MGSHTDMVPDGLSELPDYSAIRDVIHALWGVGEVRGAAVMVGAGFSRNAEQASGDAALPPLWTDFAERMARDLYPTSPEKRFGDPLRLAEEYRAALGQPALDAMIRELVPDGRWRPGPLHRELLALPWADVLTPNWDTLLERAAAEEPERAYEVVETVEAIARTRAPRIVKLHGSLPSHTPFILAEEDYRTYPRKFSPFVNLAQQVLLENDLVLLGFSGDDPNFLRWAGWVRDQLGASSRRIRLVGVLDLTSSRRRLLETQNVTPIDLAPLVSNLDPADRHRVATEIFIRALQAGRPAPAWEWLHTSHRLDDPETPEAILDSWEQERLSYPGWLLAPAMDRYRLRFSMEQPLAALNLAFDGLPPTLRARVAVEVEWRCRVSLWDLPSWLATALPAVASETGSELSRVDRFALRLALTTAARRRLDDGAFTEALRLSEAEAASEDERAWIAYERCLFARDRLDYAEVAEHLPALARPDPAWKLRRAAMLAFLRDPRAAAETVRDALLDIRARRARDRRSLWLLSREAWAHHMADTSSFDLPPDARLTLGDWPQRYREAHCDPWDEFSHFDHELDNERGRQAERERKEEPGFSPGIMRAAAKGHSWTSSAILRPFDELSRAIDQVGFARMPDFDVVESRLQAAVLLLGYSDADTWSALLTVRDGKRGLINERFGRVAIAQMDGNLAAELIRRLRASVEFGRARLRSREPDADGVPRHTKWVDRLRMSLELISRLCMRLPSGDALDLFRWGAALAHDPGWDHWWLFEPLQHLLDRSFEAVEPGARGDLATTILELPLPGERALEGMERHWPNMAGRLDDRSTDLRRQDPSWANRIATITSLAHSDHMLARARAIIVLHALFRRAVLTDTEQAAVAEAIWSAPSETGGVLPGRVDLLQHVFLDMPEPEAGSAQRAFHMDVVQRSVDGTATNEDLLSLGAAGDTIHPVKLNASEAKQIAERMLAWRPPNVDPKANHAYIVEHSSSEERASIARVLGWAVLPALDEAEFSDGLCDKVLESVDTHGPDLAETLPELVRRRPQLEERAYAILRRAMVSTSVEIVYPAARGLNKWVERARSGEMNVPVGLAAEITTLVSTRREPALRPALHLATKLVIMGLVERADRDRLAEALDVLEAETAYANHTQGGLRLDTLTLVRAGCVRLAAALSGAATGNNSIARWLDAAPSDPVPEVRFALELEAD